MPSFELVKSDEVLEVVKRSGPVQPLDIKNILKRGDSIVIGAALSELSARKLLKVTFVKKGGSPFYYVQGQEPKLEDLSKWLNQKDRQTFEMLKDAKVLKDSDQDPLTRVSLRAIKDFSREFIFNENENKVLYWRYYLISEQEAINIIKQYKAPIIKEEVKKDSDVSSKTDIVASIEQKQDVFVKAHSSEEKKKEHHKQKTKSEKPQEKTEQNKQLEKQEFLKLNNSFLEDINDEFLDKLKSFFQQKEIFVKEAKLIRKNSEYDFIIELMTPVGKAEYFCKAKNKKKSSDGDLSATYLQAQIKRLPAVYITTGEIVKKAKDKIKTEYKGMILKEI